MIKNPSPIGEPFRQRLKRIFYCITNYMRHRGNHMCISESHEEMLERSESIRGWNNVETPTFAMMIRA